MCQAQIFGSMFALAYHMEKMDFHEDRVHLPGGRAQLTP